MLRIYLLIAVYAACICPALSQAVVMGTVRDSATHEPVAGARIILKGTKYGAISNTMGAFLLKNIEAGSYTLSVSSIGYQAYESDITLAPTDSTTRDILLISEEVESDEIVVTATRTTRNIADVPVRVELIPQEEVEEKLLMKASSVSMLLSESTGMRMQTTSGASNTANLRIQGLQGRYTQILQDGIPNFGGMSSGFSLTQLPPLNLRQVEVVKGAASVLYGADAISGVVNFITREPHEKPEVSMLANVTSQKGVDAAGFYSTKLTEDIGLTTLMSYNRQELFDVDGDGFSDLARYRRFNIAPKFLWQITPDVKIVLNGGYFSEQRLGGTMNAPESAIGTKAPYLEQNISYRTNASAQMNWNIAESHAITFNIAGMQLKRDAFYGAVPFNATDHQFYADVQYRWDLYGHDILVGAAWNEEDFRDRTPDIVPRSYRFSTTGVFAQLEEALSNQWKLLLSGRVDAHNVFGTFWTPRVSLLYRPVSALTLRLGGGTGFKAPTIFVEEAEEIGFKGAVAPVSLLPERAQNIQFDANYRTLFGDIVATFNAAFYLTQLYHALVVNNDSFAVGKFFLENASGRTLTRGFELSTQYSYEDFKLSLGYTFIYADQEHEGKRYELELNPRHALSMILFYENAEIGLKTGIENYYTSSQRLVDNPWRDRSPAYWITGIMIEKALGDFRLFLNFENIFDTRQTRYDPIFTGSPQEGTMRPLPIYAPLEGRAINGGIRFVF